MSGTHARRAWRRSVRVRLLWHILLPALFLAAWLIDDTVSRISLLVLLVSAWTLKFWLSVTDVSLAPDEPPRSTVTNLSHVDRIFGLLKSADEFNGSPAHDALSPNTWRNVLEPERFRQRVKERHNVVSAYGIRKEVTIEYQPTNGAAEELVPILRPAKGSLLDGFQVFGRSGTELRTLNSEESLVLAVAMARSLFNAALGLSGRKYDNWDLRLHEAFQYCVGELIATHPRTASGSHGETYRAQVRAEVEQRARAAHQGPLTEEGEIALQGLAAFIGSMSTLYCIYAVVPAADAGLIRYTQTLRLGTHLETHRSGHLLAGAESLARQLLRLMWGAMPKSLRFDLRKASHCESYHCEVTVHGSMYIDQILVIDKHDRPVRTERAHSNLRAPHLRRSGTGTESAHVYMRNMARSEHERWARIDVLERPGGSVLRALLLAVLVLGSVLWLAIAAPATTSVDFERVGVLSLAASALPAVIGASWAVAGRGYRGRVIADLSLVSAFVSAITLLLALHLYADPEWLRYVVTKYVPPLRDHATVLDHVLNWRALVVLATYHVAAMLVALTIRVVRVRNLLDKAIQADPESVQVRSGSLR